LEDLKLSRKKTEVVKEENPLVEEVLAQQTPETRVVCRLTPEQHQGVDIIASIVQENIQELQAKAQELENERVRLNRKDYATGLLRFQHQLAIVRAAKDQGFELSGADLYDVDSHGQVLIIKTAEELERERAAVQQAP
jgi:hypothetical protein